VLFNLSRSLLGLLVLLVAACASAPPPPFSQTPSPSPESGRPSGFAHSAGTARTADFEPVNSRWVAVAWSDLPGFETDALFDAWNAWLKSCERPGPVFAALCPEIRRLSIASEDAQRQWIMNRLQPYRVESIQDGNKGLLTAYFEPEFEAQRTRAPGFEVPLFRMPDGLVNGQTWFTRQQIDTLPQAQAALRGHAIAYVSEPVQAMLLQIQGSGRLRITESDGRQRLVRLAYAGHNGHPYQSPGRWLLDHGEVRDASWPGIRAWMTQYPARTNELMWRNPRVVFFKEEPLNEFDSGFGPRGAQGVALTPGRSIAVDPQSIPYGTPVWLESEGPQVNLQRLVLAQDTGSAIRGAVRADYFAGWGAEAGELAGRLKQPLQMWVLWPKPP
jgi:membrane-bound lytic murein transglycosylase A